MTTHLAWAIASFLIGVSGVSIGYNLRRIHELRREVERKSR